MTYPLLLSLLIGSGIEPMPGHPDALSPQKQTIFERVTGTWDWQGDPGHCRDNPHAISFSSDERFMILTFRHPPKGIQADPNLPLEVRYKVLEHKDQTIRVFLVQPPENRYTPAGELVVWDLILTGRNTYVWRRTDWPASGRTRNVTRCPAKQRLMSQTFARESTRG
jgi:hypothetical protein